MNRLLCLGLLALLGMSGVAMLSGCEKTYVVRAVSVGPTYPADEEMPLPRPGSPVPQPILAIQWRSAEIYCLARDGRWQAVPRRIVAIKAAIDALPLQRENVSLRVAELAHDVRNIEDAVRVGDRLGAMLYANQVYRIALQMSVTFNPQTPAELSMLTFHVRELEVWCGMGDAVRLRQAGTQMMRDWTAAEGYMRSTGHPREATRMTALSRRLTRASTADDYTRLIRPMRVELRNLRGVVVTDPAADPAFDFD